MRAGAVLQAIREVVNVGAYLPVAEALTLHGIYRESVLILTKSSVLNAVVANRGLLRGPERCRLLRGPERCRLLRAYWGLLLGPERFRLLRVRDRSSSAAWVKVGGNLRAKVLDVGGNLIALLLELKRVTTAATTALRANPGAHQLQLGP